MKDKLSQEYESRIAKMGIELSECYEQIEGFKKRIKSLLTPIPEEKLNELIEKWAHIMETHNDLWSIEDRVKELLKEYDNLREGKEG